MMIFNAAPGLAEQIADHLGQMIIREELKPNERIQEVKVTKALNVSRGSVREALLILERRYLIHNIPRKGAVVTEFTKSDVQGLYEIIGCLYGLMGQYLVEAWQTEKDLQPFDELVAQMEAAIERNDPTALYNLSFSFSELVRNLVDNVFLNETLQNLRPAFSRIFYKMLHHQQRAEDLNYIIAFINESMSYVRARAVDKNRELVKNYFAKQCVFALQCYHNNPAETVI